MKKLQKPKTYPSLISHKNMRRNRCVRLIENTSIYFKIRNCT